ncbi:hypothetical protein MKK67_24940 [Methylobacterium sp. J-072]|uniref:hypothetical protein n=1 Tax=Methylobacterium sp. J-072 TaxID=2836651 RepID=UPI001FB89DFB|nr:hypothetical protein [Methylobacterium sp. J-072]MCJ2095721.1 hypothetical protein [Methylobacterium sp. J-072]
MRQGRSGRGWWAIAARMLARVLALSLALSLAGPGVGLAADLAFHAGGHHDRVDGPSLAEGGSSVDPGVTEHLHCGCHQVAPLETGIPAPPAVPGRPVAVRIAAALPSVVPDRLPRPPRA